MKEKNKKSYEELLKECDYDEDKLWDMYMEEHLKEERKLKKKIEAEKKKKFRL